MLSGPRNRSSCSRSPCMSLVSVDVLAFVLHMTTNSKVNDALKKVVSQLPGKFASFHVVR